MTEKRKGPKFTVWIFPHNPETWTMSEKDYKHYYWSGNIKCENCGESKAFSGQSGFWKFIEKHKLCVKE